MKNKQNNGIFWLSIFFLATALISQTLLAKPPQTKATDNAYVIEKQPDRTTLVGGNFSPDKATAPKAAPAKAKKGGAAIEVLAAPRQKPVLNIALSDPVFIDGGAGKIGFPGQCLYADEVWINGQSFRVNPVTNKFYALIKLESSPRIALRCEAKNALGTAVVVKTLIRH